MKAIDLFCGIGGIRLGFSQHFPLEVVLSSDIDANATERDIVKHIAKSGASALGNTVGGAMTRQVVTARARDTVESAMSKMTDRRIRHLPVVESGRMLGVVSIGDLVKWRIAEADAEVNAIRSYIQP